MAWLLRFVFLYISFVIVSVYVDIIAFMPLLDWHPAAVSTVANCSLFRPNLNWINMKSSCSCCCHIHSFLCRSQIFRMKFPTWLYISKFTRLHTVFWRQHGSCSYKSYSAFGSALFASWINFAGSLFYNILQISNCHS